MRRSAALGSILFLSSFALALISLPANATEVKSSTSVNVSVCSPPSLSVTSPSGDATVDTNQLTISGSIHNVSQVEIYINNTYDRAIAIPVGQETFTTSISMTYGVYEIEVLGLSACGGTQVSNVFTVTNKRASNPSNPTSPSPTQSPSSDRPSVPAPDVGVQAPDGDPVETEEGLLDDISLDGMAHVLQPRIIINDLVSVGSDGFLRGLVRFIFVVLGILLMAFGYMLVNFVRRVTRQPVRSVSFTGDVGIRFVGLVLFIVGISL